MPGLSAEEPVPVSRRAPRPPSVAAPAADDLDQTQLAHLMAHELRQPAQAIRSFVSILLYERAGPLNDVQRDFLHTADHAVRRLERLISDIEVTLTQSSALSLVAEPLDLLHQLQACLREVQPLAEANQVSLRVNAPAGVSFICEADPDRIDQVLLNLIENACHYATRGTTVELTLRRSRTRMLCTVTNCVEAIPLDADSWSAAFWRGNASKARHPQGKGLGLTVINQLIAAHGGYTLSRFSDASVSVGFVLPVGRERAPTR